MSLRQSRKSRKLFVAGLVALTLAAVLISCLRPRGSQPGGGGDGGKALRGHTLPVQALVFSADGATLTSAAYRLEVPKVEVTSWDVKTGAATATPTARLQALRDLAFTPGGRRWVTAGQDRSLWLWDAAARRGRQLGETPRLVYDLTLSQDGNQLATVDFEYVVTLWDIASGQQQCFCLEDGLYVCSLAFAPDGATLAGGVKDHTIRLWDTVRGTEGGILRGRAGPVVAALAFSPDGRTLASGDLGGAVKLWDMAERAERATLEAAQGPITAVMFSPDGRMLSVAVDRAVQLWDVATSTRIASLEGHEGRVQCLEFSQDGTRLASGSHDKTVRLLQVPDR
jgi:WD40 repeat protein